MTEPTSVKRFVGIDEPTVVTAREREVIDLLGATLLDARRLHQRLAATMHAMRGNQAGQPRSGLAGGDGAPVPWCWVHERDVTRCHEDPELVGEPLCEGEILTGPSDPTGSAAIGGDPAARDLRKIQDRLVAGCEMVRQAVAIASKYPVQPAQLEDAEPSPGEDWCRACWKDDKYCEPITIRRSTGKPYYRGLCRWCGETAKVLGQDPPTWMVAKRHAGRNISEEDMRRAKKRRKK